jgi:hypothetical protein
VRFQQKRLSFEQECQCRQTSSSLPLHCHFPLFP